MLEDFLTLVDGGDCHLIRLVRWVCLLVRCVTNSNDIHKMQLSRIMRYYVGSCGRNAGHFRLSCIRLVCFLRKSTEFHRMRMECQRIPIHFLLLISHKSPVYAKRCPLPYLLSLPDCYDYVHKVMVYIKRGGVSWWWWRSMQWRGVKGDMI